MYEFRYVGGIGVSITDEALADPRLEDRRFEYPPMLVGIRGCQDCESVDAEAMTAFGQSQQASVGYVPAVSEIGQITPRHRKGIFIYKALQSLEGRSRQGTE
jgi:hypothetical protein